MDIFFQDPTAIPLPPDEVRIKEMKVEALPDNRRVRVHLELTPFQQRPNGEIRIDNANGDEVASISIIESMMPSMDFTVHLRGPKTSGTFTVSADIYYLQSPDGVEQGVEIPLDQMVRLSVDQAQKKISIPVSAE